MSSPLFEKSVVIAPDSEFGFRYVTDVPKFEDEVIVPVVEPRLSLPDWQARPALQSLITPDPKIFRGRLHDITLTVLDAPVERLLDAKTERGRKFSATNYNFYVRMANLISSDSSLLARCMGFTFRALASSSRQANITPVEADIWYLPDPREIDKTGDTEGRQLLRLITKPEYDEAAIKAVHRASSRMGAPAANSGSRSPVGKVRLDARED